MRLKQAIKYMISIPKTVYFNFKTLPFRKALKLPLFVAYNVKILSAKRGIITFDVPKLKRFMASFGFNGTEEVSARQAKINLTKGKLIIRGTVRMAEGCVVGVSGGVLILGDNFSANKNCFISCNREIVFGNDVLIGWNTLFFDATGHTIYRNGAEKPLYRPIRIGNHVWVCAEAHIMKGSEVQDGSVVAYRSTVTNAFVENDVLIGGSPAKIIQNGITWTH